jgi:hypothetical protein
MGGVSSGLACTWLSEPSSSEPSTIAGSQDPLYLFACHLEWHHWRNLEAYQALVAALDDSENGIREIAELLLHRISPRPQRESRDVYRK